MIEPMIDRQSTAERIKIALLIFLHTIICCSSLVYIADGTYQLSIVPSTFHIFYDSARLHVAALAVAAFALASIPFCFARFSFGYVVGFYFYTMISGYLWLNCFTDLNYDHRMYGLSAAISAVTFLLPVLFIVSPIPQIYTSSARGFDRLLRLILSVAIVAIIAGASYNFRIVGIINIYDFREILESPRVVGYAIGIVSGALLPFAFAGFLVRKAYWQAGVALLLLLLIYPINLSKLALFAPFWLLGVLLLCKVFDIKTAVVMSLLVDQI